MKSWVRNKTARARHRPHRRLLAHSTYLISFLFLPLFVSAETIAVVGATVHTLGPQGVLSGATVLIEDGRIAAVGPAVAVPAGARVIDAAGKVVTPGLFDSMSRIGLVEVSLEAGGRDFATEDPRATAALSVADAFNPRSALVEVNRAEGLTRAMVAPDGRGGPFSGQAAVVRLGGPGEFLVRSPAALVATLGEAGAARNGGSRAVAFLRLREALDDARDFAAHRDAWAAGARRDYAPSRLDLEAIGRLVAGEVPLAAVADRASDLEAAVALADEYGLRLVVTGGAEAWRAAPALARAGAAVVLDPLANLPSRLESLGATMENAARLYAAGVEIAFSSGDAHNGRNLRQAAGNAVAHGLPWEVALAAITLAPARIWGEADRCGSIEPGKDADLVIWDGDPLEVTSFALRVFVAGREVPTETYQTRLRDRFLRLDGLAPPALRPSSPRR